MHKFGIIVISLILYILLPVPCLAKHKVVKTAAELTALLSEDKEQGTILLDGNLFSIAGLEVKAGGIVKPYPGRTPVLIGFHQKAVRSNRQTDEHGYWKAKIKGYGSTQIVFLDEHLESIPCACHINGKDGFVVKASQIKVVSEKDRLVKIPIPDGFDFLRNRDKQFLKNFTVKMGYWFAGMELWQMYSDGENLYGTINSDYNLKLLSVRPYANVQIEFFNLPKEDEGVFLDGDDMLHVPSAYSSVMVCTTSAIFKLVGDRELTFDHVTFTGANNETVIVNGSNKHFKHCTIKNCCKGIVKTGDKTTGCSVEDCRFENLFSSCAVGFSGIDKAVVRNNTIVHTGSLMKGGAVITVGGLDFCVQNNTILDFSYIGISIASGREYRPGSVSGLIDGNIVDNAANYGVVKNQLDDGGGIYVLAHTDGVIVSNNIVKNIGYEGAWMHGIYLDDGAYNVTVKRNLVYNVNSTSKAIYSRYVESCDRSNMNNVFDGNICIGNCVMAGNRKGFGEKTVVTGNFISGAIENEGDAFVSFNNNQYVTKATVKNNGVIKMGRRSGLKKWNYSKAIRRLITT